jgi:hypothetical protein
MVLEELTVEEAEEHPLVLAMVVAGSIQIVTVVTVEQVTDVTTVLEPREETVTLEEPTDTTHPVVAVQLDS